MYALPVCHAIAKKVHFQDPISLLIAPSAAKQGEANSVNTINAYALTGVNICDM